MYVFATFFLSLVMMNLIVALMSDTYNNVMTNIQVEDSRQLNQLILMYENMMFWQKQEGEPKYFFWLQYGDTEETSWTSVCDHITSKLEEP